MTDAASPPSPALLEQLKAIVGPDGYFEAESDKQPFLVDERELYNGRAAIVVLPASTAEVSAVVAACASAGVGIVPQGGKTGYVGGGVPHESGHEIVLSLKRLNRIREVDIHNFTMTVEAGCVLADVQAEARTRDRFFPLSLGAEGSCQIGGNLSTNAGGVAVLRYGNARELVLGLEVVLPDGQIWDGLKSLRKDNTGYDLRHLFMGAEGTLGVITAAVLKVFPVPVERCTALVALRSPADAADLLEKMRTASGDNITSFEYISRSALKLVVEHVDGASDPFDQSYEHYALVELSTSRPDARLADVFEQVLERGFERDEVRNAVVASSEAQAQALWRLRETIPEAQKRAGGSIKHDVSVPVSRVPEFLQCATRLCVGAIEDVRVIAFGHMGDGNIHFNLTQPLDGDEEVFARAKAQITPMVHDLVAAFGGSFSAEHGVGRFKRDELERYGSPVALAAMRAVKQALDPKGIMNPGKVL